MENKNNSDISAEELLAKLKANMAENSDISEEEKHDGRKKYKFRRSGRITAPVSEEDIKAQMPKDGYSFESPVPKSDIEDLDIDELMKKYLPEDDYKRMATRSGDNEDEDDFVRTLSSIDMPEEAHDEDVSDSYAEENVKSYTTPDSELYDHLSEGGKVCDVPELDSYDSMADTMQAPLRPMTDVEKTIAFVSDDDEGGFMSVREILALQNAPDEPEENENEATSDDTVVIDLEKTAEIVLDEAEAEETSSDTITFNALEQMFSEPENEEPQEEEASEADEPVNDEEEASDITKILDIEDITDGEDLFLDESVFDDIYSETLSGIVEAEDSLDDAMEEAFSDSDEGLEAYNEETIDDGTEESSEEISEENSEEVALVAAETNEYSELYGELAEDEFDETDANLMLAFGMDEELDAAIGKESADKLRTEMDNLISDEELQHENPKPEAPAEPIKEFVSPTEIKGIFDNYKAEYGKSAIRLFVIAAITAILFFYENVGIFGGSLPDAFKAEYYPIVYIMTGFQLLLIGFATMYKSVISGFKSLISKKPTAESFLPVMLGVSALYSVLACFFGASGVVLGFNFPMALSLLFFAIGKRLDLRREIMTFRIISSKRSKFALEKLDIIDAELETRAFDKFLPKQPDIFRINKTSFVDGYFRRTGEYSSAKQVLLAYIPATLIAFVFGILVGIIADKTFSGALSTGYAAFAFALPATVFFTFSLPMFRASKVCYDDHSAIVGEGSLDEYTSASSISFDDREVFPTAGVKLRSIKVFGSGRLDTAIYYMASVYSCIGGPLSDVLNVATADIGRAQDIDVISIDADGIETVIDGHHLYVGKADYLRHNGYLPVTDPEDEEIEGGDISITFLVCDDEVIAKFYVRYRIDPEFEATLKSLYKSGICVGIKTVDPNINDEMLSTRIRLTKYPVRVLKYDDINDRSRGSDRTDSGIVSKKSVKALLRAFTLCDKTKHITKTNLMIASLTTISGIAITAAVAFLGSIAAVGSVYVALFQLFWLVPVYLISRFLLM